MNDESPKRKNHARVFNTSTFIMLLLTLSFLQCKKDDFTNETKGLCPVVLFTDPANDDVNVVLNTKITATFNEAMDSSTINWKTFIVHQGTVQILGTVSYSGIMATFSPNENLISNTVYTGTISTETRDLDGNYLQEDYVWSFTTGSAIDTVPPLIIATDPVNGATNVVLNKKITASFNESMDPNSIHNQSFMLMEGANLISGTISFKLQKNGSSATFTPDVDLTLNTIYTGIITTVVTDASGNPLANDFKWSFRTGVLSDNVNPIVISTDPADGAINVALNKNVTATFSEPMNPSSLNSLTYTLKIGTTNVPGSVSYNGNNAVYIPTKNLTPSTTYTATITTGATDASGNPLLANYTWIFTTGFSPDITRPVVISTDPMNSASNVALNKIITATFSEPMDPNTINPSTFLLKFGTNTVPGVISYSGNNAVYTPLNKLTPSTTYTGTITTGAKDAAGNTLASNYVWSFTTGIAADTTRPIIISTDPDNLDINVAINKNISATFSKSMDPLTINSTTFLLKQGTNNVSGGISYSGNKALYSPTNDLMPNTKYNATITNSVKDATGNFMANDYTWSFTTGSVLDTVKPKVILTNPTNNANNVALNEIITADFSKIMDPMSINSSTFTLKQGANTITGGISYSGNKASFNPTNNLLSGTTYTVTITTGAKDLSNNSLASNYVWTFSTLAPLGPGSINLDCAADFACLAGSTVTNTGGSIVSGDLGLSPGTAVIGFPPGKVINGAILINSSKANAAKLCLTDAYNDGAGRSTNVIVNATGELGGLTLAPGLYKSAPGSFGITSSDLTLDAKGDKNAVWIFQMPSSTLNVGNGRKVILSGGAQAKNVYWIVGTSATIGTTAEMKGNILADQSITLKTGASLLGRALTRIAAVTLDNNKVTKP